MPPSCNTQSSPLRAFFSRHRHEIPRRKATRLLAASSIGLDTAIHPPRRSLQTASNTPATNTPCSRQSPQQPTSTKPFHTNRILHNHNHHHHHIPLPPPSTRPFSTLPTHLFPPSTPHPTTPTPLTPSTYHTLSDTYIDLLVTQLESLQETRADIDVEYSAGVLTLTFPPNGTYVLNKQPPNRQIWLSSPVSGPKRYDWVVAGGEGERGDWVYLRDGSTLGGLLEEEVGVRVEGEGDEGDG
ncbi:Mitochondrial matrix iron chaperone [Lecanora helva]